MDDVRRLVALAAHRLRCEVRTVRLGEDAVARHAGGSVAQLRSLRIGDVPGERDVPAAVECGLDQRRRGEAVEDDGAVETVKTGQRVLVGRTRVDDDGLAKLARELELSLEERTLRSSRRVVAEVVETRLADGDRALVTQQTPKLVEIGRLAGLVRVHAEAGIDAVVR